jgi:hypothetical protein
MTQLPDKLRKSLLLEFARWASDYVDVDVIIEQHENRGPSPEQSGPYLIVSSVNLAIPTTTVGKSWGEGDTAGLLDETREQHFRGTLQVDAIGPNAAIALIKIGMLTDKGDKDIAVSPFQPGGVTDNTSTFEGYREDRTVREFEIRYKLKMVLEDEVPELQLVNMTIENEDNETLEKNIDITA